MTTITVELEVDVTGRVIAAVPEAPPAYAHGGLPGEPAHVEDLRITMRVPARLIGAPDRAGCVTVDLTDLVCEADREAAVDALVDEAQS